jgi:hypothetical protein
MVIGKDFAWAHLPKTGGDATLSMFRVFIDLVEFADREDSNDKHANFRGRAQRIRGKLLVMNIRRLPAWVLSRAQHVSRRGMYPDYEPIPMARANDLADSSFPDSRLMLHTADGWFWPDHWLRVETLAADFLDFVSDLRDVSDSERKRVMALGPVNSAEYDHQLARWFTPEQVRRMYLNNPSWATLEQELYGDLYELEDEVEIRRVS